MIAYKIHLIRTGTTGENGSPRRFAGQSDIPLSNSGIQALGEIRQSMNYPEVEMVFSSPLSRCVRTADILFPNLYSVKDEGFTDMNLGEFEGKTFDELKSNPAFNGWIGDSANNTPPGGEATTEFTKRVALSAGALFDRMMRQRIRSCAVVTHGGVIMTLLASIGLPKLPIQNWAVDNGFGYTLLLTPQMWMRDRAVEIFAPIPYGHDGSDQSVE